MTKYLYVLVGPSGVGKTFVSTFLEERGLQRAITATTRKQREGEGEAYLFLSYEEFDSLQLVEHTTFAGNKYGLPVDSLVKSDFCILDLNGVRSLREVYTKRPVLVIGLTAPESVIAERLKARDVDDVKRIEHDTSHFATLWLDCDVVFTSTQPNVRELIWSFIQSIEK